jgi:hypothetical protein
MFCVSDTSSHKSICDQQYSSNARGQFTCNSEGVTKFPQTQMPTSEKENLLDLFIRHSGA